MQMPFDLDNVHVKTYPPPKINKKEILRYAGASSDASELCRLVDECIAEVDDSLIYKVCYRITSIYMNEDELDFGFFKTSSSDLNKNLRGCFAAVIFAATVGTALDRLIARYNRVSPAKALLIQAVGNERIESLCDAFNDDITEVMKKNGYVTRPRFSPGYGDLTLGVQRNIFSVLDCPKRIGLTLNDSLLMSPSKSVTAIIGIASSENR